MKFDTNVDYYVVMQIDQSANGSVVLAAYRVLQELYMDDPDRRHTLERAYQILSHPTQRTQYDTFRARLKAGEDAPDVAILCPVCESKNVLNPLKDNRTAICGICRAKLSQDLIGKAIRSQARRNILALFKTKYGKASRAYRSSAIWGAVLLTVAFIGTATFFGYKANWSLPFEVSLDGLPGMNQAAPAQPRLVNVPIQQGEGKRDALAALTKGGWQVTSRYDVTGPSGNEHVVEVARQGINGRVYFRANKVQALEGF